MNDKTVVRVNSGYFECKSGAVYQRKVTTLKRKSKGYDIWKDEIDNVGAEDALQNINNLHEVEDGIYQLVAHGSRDYWSGIYEIDYYSLIPYAEDQDE